MEEKRVKEGKLAISGQFPRLVSVPEQGGTGTTYTEAKWYRYHPKWYRYHSPEQEWYRYRCNTTFSCSPSFLYFDIFKPRFIYQ